MLIEDLWRLTLLASVFAGGAPLVMANDELAVKYGALELPSHIKYYEVEASNRLLLNPYLQVASDSWQAVLDPNKEVYDWCINAEANVILIEPIAHPRGRRYQGSFVRPEDGYNQSSGYVEKYGHVSASGGLPARICGEVLNNRALQQWQVNNKSGRYSKGIADRTPEKLVRAAALIRQQVDGGGQAWGATIFLLEYGPEAVSRQAERLGMVQYVDPANKKVPFLVF